MSQVEQPENILGTVGHTSSIKPGKKVPPRRQRNELSRKREYLTKLEVEKLVSAARKTGRYGQRDSLMLEMMYRHGLRVSELIDLKWDQVIFSSGLHVTRLKNGKDSVQPLDGKEVRALRQMRREDPESLYVFNSERKAPLTRRAVHKIVARAGQLAGIEFPVHPHMLRHSIGHRLADQNVDTRTIQDYLGHKSIQHTVRYTELSPNKFKSIAKLI